MDFGCSSFSWETADGLHLLGRTYDQRGDLSHNAVWAVPRGYPLPLMPDASPALPGKHAFVGMAALHFGTPIFTDGVNEHGLAIALLNFPGCGPCAAPPHKRPVYPGFLPGCLLGQCACLQDAVDMLSHLRPEDPQLQGHAMSVHYILSDPSGETIVAEPGPNDLQIYRSTIGVLTNSPDYPWQLTHLRFRAIPAPQEVQPSPLSPHTGMGDFLPGGYSSPSRFLRLSLVKSCAPKVSGELNGVTEMFRCFSTVDTPPGLMDSPENPFQTLCTSVMCLESRTYYFSPASDRRISAIRPGDPNGPLRSFSIPQTQDISWLTT